mgnify:CR=1 FL=1
MPHSSPANVSDNEQPITIIHNHTDWVIVNKPSGISMQHEQGDISTPSLQQRKKKKKTRLAFGPFTA